VAHAYNPSYSEGRDQEDCSLKPAQANSSQDPILKKPITKMGWWSGVGPEFRSQYWKKKSLLNMKETNLLQDKIPAVTKFLLGNIIQWHNDRTQESKFQLQLIVRQALASLFSLNLFSHL
jgi:hypothetical protein